MCGKVDLGCQVRSGFQSVATNMFNDLAAKIGETASSGLQAVATFWMKLDTPKLATQTGEHTWKDNGPVAYLHSYSTAVAISVFTLAILIAGMRTAWEQRAEPLRELLKATMTLVMVAGAGTAAIQLLSAWSDSFALDIVQNATPKGKQFHTALGGLVLQGGAQGAGFANVPLLVGMFFGVAVFIASVIQVILLLIRSAMLVLLAGTFPIAAAATNTEAGKAWFKKYCAWALAFIAYKPAAALIYAAAMKMNEAGMTSKSGNGMVQALTGLMMMLLAVFALPALLRFAVPITAAVAGGSAGAGAGVADPGNLATGAINLGRSGGGSGAFGGGGSGGGGGGGRATGAIGVGASAGLAAAGAAVSGAKKAGGGLAGAASHSAGEAGGGSPTPSSSSGNRSSGGGRRGSSRSSSSDKAPQPTGPTGSG